MSTAPRRSIGGSAESYRFESTEEYPNPVPAKAACRARSGCRSASAASRMHPRRPTSTSWPVRSSPGRAPPTRRSGRLPDRRPDRARRGAGGPTAEADAAPVRLVFLGGLGEIGRNCRVCRGRGTDPGARRRDHVPRPGHARRRPGPPRFHLPAGERGAGRRHHPHPRSRGPHRRARLPAPRFSAPVYGSELTLALARNRVDEAGLAERAQFVPVRDGERRRIGPCDVEFIPVTHSVPHAFATAFPTRPRG